MKEIPSKRGSSHACAFGFRAVIARLLMPLVLGASLVSTASAGVVFQQLPVGGNDAFSSISAEQSADGFTLSTTTAVTGFTWWGSYAQDPATLPTDAFRVRYFAGDGSGAPNAIPTGTISQQPTRSLTSLFDKTGAPVYRFDLVVAPVTLAGGTDWYLSVVNQFDAGDPKAVWYWLLSDARGENFYRAVDGDPWATDLTGNFAFQVSGDPGTPIPLPGSLLLLLSGLAGLKVAGLHGRGRWGSSPVES